MPNAKKGALEASTRPGDQNAAVSEARAVDLHAHSTIRQFKAIWINRKEQPWNRMASGASST
jgi:hypothetical protein